MSEPITKYKLMPFPPTEKILDCLFGAYSGSEIERYESAMEASPTPTGETPETDAFVLTHIPAAPDPDGLNPYLIMSGDLAEFARKLERERNAALAKLKDQS